MSYPTFPSWHSTTNMFKITFNFILIASFTTHVTLVMSTLGGNHNDNINQSNPFGFGSQTTGGGSSLAQTPSSLKELESWLSDNVPRVILIDREFDFTYSEGNKTEIGCSPWPKCNKKGTETQNARNSNGWCNSNQKKKKISHPNQTISSVSITYHLAAIKPLGVGHKGVIKGKGLAIQNQKNIIIQNIHITGLNPDLVWGGDGLSVMDAQDVWVDHCTFSLIGREMIVLGFGPNIGVTLSNNLFNGTTRWSPSCRNKHYWCILVAGKQEITMANNCIHQTSGRSPKMGGSDDSDVKIHYYNNIHTDGEGKGLEVEKGAKMLAEGNLFKNSYPVNKDDADTENGGYAYVPFTQEEVTKCYAYLGRPCVSNEVVGKKGKTYNFGKSVNVLETFKGASVIKSSKIEPTTALVKGPPGGCGVGLM
ncbi:hypothetical protein CROQUDRAFT_655962 [Cronartium quercuum f. sp. fusiforme G11]|uniref:pectin lyase n=1 Tax=Cronartium quercuum f. sp. fusiforme G11 TaxID=708437 RepID=A0A9P6TCP2_9BASI|nr:hypothetical protein CROQUDRAFT_655962 [Cronartium quercuum f. sp. fusiforme G11]